MDLATAYIPIPNYSSASTQVLSQYCQIARMYSPPFRPMTAEEDEAIVERINETKPDFVWVGLGAPKQSRVFQEFHQLSRKKNVDTLWKQKF